MVSLFRNLLGTAERCNEEESSDPPTFQDGHGVTLNPVTVPDLGGPVQGIEEPGLLRRIDRQAPAEIG